MIALRYILVLLSLLVPFNLAVAATSSAVPLDKVVAIVNRNVITQSQLDTAMKDMKVALQMTGAPVPDDATIKKQALDQLILKKLELDIAARNKLTVTDKQLDDAVMNIAKQNNMTMDQLKMAIAQQGISYTRFRQQIHDQILIHELQQSLFGGNVRISEQEVKDFMKKAPTLPNPNTQYYVDDLLIPVDQSATPAAVASAQKTAQTLLAQAQQGKSFADLASASTTDVQHTDMGWRRINDLPAIFAQTVAGMQANAIKGPIRAPNGFHLLKVLSIRGGQSGPLTEAEAKNVLFQQKIQLQINTWQDQIRKSAYIKVM